MTNIRNRAGSVMIVVLALAFGGLWMLQDTGVFNAVGSGGAQRSGNIIVVDGDAISAQDYGQAVQQQTQMMERQGRQVTPQMRDQIGDQVYERLVTLRLREHEMDRLGLAVTADEVENAVLGENPDPVVGQLIRASVPPQQLPQDGQIDRAFLQQLFSQPAFAPRLEQIEQVVRGQIRDRKLRALLGATVHVSSEDIEDFHRRQNHSVDTRYVVLPYAQVPDDQVSVTDSDLQSYYDENREDFRRPRTYAVQYVTRTKEATAADTAAVASDLEALRQRFASAENDSLFLQRRGSERAYSSAFRSASALDPAIAQAVFANPQPGQIVGPVFSGQQAHLVKVTGVRDAEQPSVRARHILLRGEEDALQQARQIKQQITSGNADFAAMARRNSEDPGSAERGGDLGWFGRGRMAPAFEEAAFSASPGQVVGPVETNFGYHLIKVEGRADQEVQVADLALGLRPSVATLGETEDQMRDISVFANEEGDFESQAQRAGLDVQTATVAADGDDGTLTLQPIEALGPSQQLKNFLSEASAGATSDVIELDEQFVVAHVGEITEAGYRPLDEVRGQVEAQVLRQKKQAVQVEKLQQAMDQAGENGLDALAQAAGTTARAQSGVTFNTGSIPALGADGQFVGTALGLSQGATSGVVAGENGAFVLTVTRVNEAPALTDEQRQQLRQQLLQQRRQQMQQQWMASLRENAQIEDNRAQYQ